jgi:hypothetical protein
MIYLSSDNKHILYITETWTLQKENNAKRRESFVLKQIYFNVNNDNALAHKYSDLESSAVKRFQKVNNCLKMAKYGRNM